jgi:hypothetical protein
VRRNTFELKISRHSYIHVHAHWLRNHHISACILLTFSMLRTRFLALKRRLILHWTCVVFGSTRDINHPAISWRFKRCLLRSSVKICVPPWKYTNKWRYTFLGAFETSRNAHQYCFARMSIRMHVTAKRISMRFDTEVFTNIGLNHSSFS